MVILINDVQHFSKAVSDTQDQLQKLNVKYHPLIIVLGESYSSLKQFFIYFDNYTFKFDSFLSCIDMGFKLFQVFHLSYPSQSYGIWLFLQQYFFKLSTKYDKHISKVTGLVSFLNNSNI